MARLSRPAVSPEAYRRLTLAAAVAVAAIIVTGAGVRLTGSGLGCPDWPTCDADRIVAPLEYHAMVEFANRTVTGLVSLAVMGAVLGSLVRTPRRRDLTWLSLGLVAGVVGQIVLGGITVLVHLHPASVAAHFLLSMLILADAVVLHERAGEPDGPRRPRVTAPALRRAVWAVVALAAAVLVAGTAVTGSGPHGGDEEARRFGFTPEAATQVHSLLVWALLATTVAVAWLVRRHGATAVLGARLEALLTAIVAQGALGYVQYFMDVPPVLVALHIAGAIVVWTAALRLALALDHPDVPAPAPAPPAAALPVPG